MHKKIHIYGKHIVCFLFCRLFVFFFQSTLAWGPWFWYKAWSAGTTTLSAVDTIGEFLASLFGITTPR